MSFPLRLVLAFAAAAALAAGALIVLPTGGGDRPPESELAAIAVLVAGVMGAAIFVAVRLDLGLPASIAFYAVGWNALVVLVKLWLGPQALYRASEEGRVTTDFGKDDALVLTALAVGAAYLLAFWILYRVARRRIEARQAARRSTFGWGMAAIVLVLLFVSGLLPVVLLLFVLIGGEYVQFVFTTGSGLVAAAALAAATALAALALNGAADRARAVGNATLLTSLFWVGAAYLALYHALWVVYLLVLTSLWPLKVVTSK